MESYSHQHEERGNGAIGRWVFWGFALVAGYFLLTEHRAHLVSFLPFLLLAACPLMHLFHHGRHGHHHAGTHKGDAANSPGQGHDSGASRNSD